MQGAPVEAGTPGCRPGGLPRSSVGPEAGQRPGERSLGLHAVSDAASPNRGARFAAPTASHSTG